VGELFAEVPAILGEERSQRSYSLALGQSCIHAVVSVFEVQLHTMVEYRTSPQNMQAGLH
jgi:hypothetical protein